MSWYVYDIIPIDFGWENLNTVKETLSTLAAADGSEFTTKRNDINDEAVLEFIDKWASAKDAASAKGWEGDFRHEPCVFWLPSEINFACGFVFKQDNNGTTFVVSPEPLPWLDKLT